MKLVLDLLRTKFAVIRLPPTKSIPQYVLAADASFLSITKTADELSIVCPESLTTYISDAKIEKGWVAFKVRGPLDFGLTGILAGLAQPLAKNDISIFAISTYDTDYVLVKEGDGEKSAVVFKELGHTVVRDR